MLTLTPYVLLHRILTFSVSTKVRSGRPEDMEQVWGQGKRQTAIERLGPALT